MSDGIGGDKVLKQYDKLIRNLFKGNDEAFEEIVDEYQNMIYKVCFKFMKNEQDALDMSQEVFILIYKNIDQFAFRSQLSTWIYRICVNTCLARLKKINKLTFEYDNENRFCCDSISPEYEAELKEIIALVDTELKGMGEKVQKVGRLRLFEGFSFIEIAKLLKISDSTARTYFMRCRNRLQKKIRSVRKEDEYL